MTPWMKWGLNPPILFFSKKDLNMEPHFYRDSYDNVAFLYVSDDMNWGKKNLKNKESDLVKSHFISSTLFLNNY